MFKLHTQDRPVIVSYLPTRQGKNRVTPRALLPTEYESRPSLSYCETARHPCFN